MKNKIILILTLILIGCDSESFVNFCLSDNKFNKACADYSEKTRANKYIYEKCCHDCRNYQRFLEVKNAK